MQKSQGGVWAECPETEASRQERVEVITEKQRALIKAYLNPMLPLDSALSDTHFHVLKILKKIFIVIQLQLYAFSPHIF